MNIERELMAKELYKNRSLYFENINIPEINEKELKTTFENDLKDYFNYLDNITFHYKKMMQYKVDLLENDTIELRKVFILERLKEADTRNRITCLLALFNTIDNEKMKRFLELLDNSSYFNGKGSRDDAFQEVKDIRGIEELKQYVINKING
jgi:hypothetical protein